VSPNVGVSVDGDRVRLIVVGDDGIAEVDLDQLEALRLIVMLESVVDAA